MSATARYTAQIVVGVRPWTWQRLRVESELRNRSISELARGVLEMDYPPTGRERAWHTNCVPEIRPAKACQLVVLLEPGSYEHMEQTRKSVPGLTRSALVRQTLERAYPDTPIGEMDTPVECTSAD